MRCARYDRAVLPAPRLKPPMPVRPRALVARRARAVLAPLADDALFVFAEVLGEGRASGSTYFGTTLITIDLARLGVRTSEDARDVLEAAERSVRVRLRAMRLGLSDALRRIPRPPRGAARISTSIRLDGGRLLLDVDLELPIELPSSAVGE